MTLRKLSLLISNSFLKFFNLSEKFLRFTDYFVSMANYQVSINGIDIVYKNTHYETYPNVGITGATLMIRWDIYRCFKSKFGYSMNEAENIRINADFIPNSQRVRECQDPYKPGSHLIGTVFSLEDIISHKRSDKRQEGFLPKK